MTDPVTTWLAAGSLLVALGCVLYVRLSGPIATRRYLNNLGERLQSLEDVLESIDNRWAKYRESLEALVEEMEATAERVGRMRRSATAAASRAKKANGDVAGALDPSNPEHLRALARTQGHQV